MKKLITIIIIFLIALFMCSCAVQQWAPNARIETTLVEWKRWGMKEIRMFVRCGNDTVPVLWQFSGRAPKLVKGMPVYLEYDSTGKQQFMNGKFVRVNVKILNTKF